MMLLLVLLYTLLLHRCRATITESMDYTKLVQFANLASVGYCVSHGISTGRLGDPETNCSLNACSNSMLKDVEIIRIFDFNKMNEVGTGYYAVDKERQTIILVFRGSSSNRDWATNLNFAPIEYTPIVHDEEFTDAPVYNQQTCEGCQVHRGFYQFLRDNSGAIISAGVKMKQRFPEYQFLIIGHSLGAAFTVMCGVEFLLLGYDPLVVTFGGPRVGNQEFVDYANMIFETEKVANDINMNHDFNSGYIRVVHRHDIIPSLPPMFSHAGFEYFIDKKDLPHKECNLNRRGMEQSHLLWKRSSGPSLRPGSFWPDRLGKYEHTHYFRRITSCRN